MEDVHVANILSFHGFYFSRLTFDLCSLDSFLFHFKLDFCLRRIVMLRIVDLNCRNKSKGTPRLHLEFILK